MNHTNVEREHRWSTCLFVATVGMIVSVFLCSGALLFYGMRPPSPQAVFERATGFAYPLNAKVISAGNDGFMTDGEFHIVIYVDDETVSQFLRTQPAAPLSNWQVGPVPTEIGSHCAFGTEDIGLRSVNGGPMHYAGDPELVELFSSDGIMYSAHERCCDSIRWHNGTLLIVDPRTNKVWLSIWNY